MFANICLIATISKFSVACGMVGFALGVFLGFRFRTVSNESLPLCLGLGLGALFYWLSELLVLFFAVGGLLAIVLLAIVYRKIVADNLRVFATAAGRQFRWLAPSFIRRAEDISEEFEDRRSYLATTPLEEKQRDTLLKNEESLYRQALMKLSRLVPYLDNENDTGGFHNTTGIDDLFDTE